MTNQKLARDANPPRWAERLLRVILKPGDKDTITGDLLEEYREAVVPHRGVFRAELWYVGQILSLIHGVRFGLVCGALVAAYTWMSTNLSPLAEDTPVAVGTFFGTILLMWAVGGYAAQRRSGRIVEATRVGAIGGVVTMFVLNLTTILRNNVFLDSVSQRSDWQGLIWNFHQSGFHSFRAYANYVYVRGTPLILFIGFVAGATSGVIGGSIGRIGRNTAHTV
jgi:hypothetical protein